VKAGPIRMARFAIRTPSMIQRTNQIATAKNKLARNIHGKDLSIKQSEQRGSSYRSAEQGWPRLSTLADPVSHSCAFAAQVVNVHWPPGEELLCSEPGWN
jgi:hypothetical protein